MERKKADLAARKAARKVARARGSAAGWVRLADLAEPRVHHAACGLAGRLYVVGGNDSVPGVAKRSVEVLDPSADGAAWA